MKCKKIIGLLMIGVLSLGLVACAKPEVQTKTTKKVEAEGMVSGTLESFSSGIVKIKSNKKAQGELSFEVKDATIECKNMLAGDQVVVVYKGNIRGTDTSNAKVEKVIDDGKGTSATETTETTIVGTVVSASMNTIQIQTNDGQRYSFATIGAEHLYKNGIQEGNWVAITYVGTLKGTDTTGVKVLKVRDDDANTIAKAQEQMNIQAVDETVYATAGVYIRKSYSTDSDILSSLAQGSSIKRTGICDNGWSRVIYNDTDAYVYGDYLTTAAPPAEPAAPATTAGDTPGTPQTDTPGTSLPVDVPTIPQEQPATDQPEKHELVGIVEDVSMGAMTVLVNDSALFFATSDAEHDYKNGIQRGNEVVITYTGTINGTDTANIVVLSVKDTNENSTPTVTGTIADATMNTVTITTEDGINITFSLENTTVNCANGIVLSSPVIVTIDLGSIIETSNIFPAIQIDDAP